MSTKKKNRKFCNRSGETSIPLRGTKKDENLNHEAHEENEGIINILVHLRVLRALRGYKTTIWFCKSVLLGYKSCLLYPYLT